MGKFKGSWLRTCLLKILYEPKTSAEVLHVEISIAKAI